ncbi:MFS family permease [Saccharomonospora amisosensis]|uniref:MFS family permease n=1 Tax=Saccharomonospora amisosensis TaxID=1128677 RepID=A0A7X5ZPL0_9PSEU|nr:MFS transporter [Saccharomonospora amisosensis]NIJ10839.1 MFS family permease [Saccharomonospora amisosensis]
MLADAVPLYTLLFAETGLTEAQISALFALWSVVGVLGEVPTGALADRFSRRTALVAGSVAQAACYALWTAYPGFLAFAAGFVLWGLGGTLVSGALEALLYDGLTAEGAGEHFARVYGDVHALGLVAQLPAAVAATLLYPVGGFALVGWASVGMCLAAAFVASRLPEPPRAVAEPVAEPAAEQRTRYLSTLRTGMREALRRPLVRGAVLAVALLASLDGVEEYFPLLAGQWQVPVTWIPLAVVAIPLAGAAGSALAGRLGLYRLRASRLALLLAASVPPLLVASVLARPGGLVAVAACYAVYRAVLVVGSARLQERIESTSRATVTSVAGLGTDLASLLLFGAWALAGLPAVAVLALLVAAALPYGLRTVGSRVRGRAPT